MNNESILGLVHNASLLLAMVLVFDLISKNWQNQQTTLQKIISGIIVGGIGITIMFTPWVLIPGLIFDTRSILLGISGLFFGPLPTIIAMGMTIILRVYQGGPGAVMGVSVILATGTIGIFWRRLRKQPMHTISWKELYCFGIVIHIVMLALAFTLPLENAMKVINSVGLPVIIIYPVGTALLGFLLTSRLQRANITRKIYESEIRYKIVADNNFGWEYWYDPTGRYLYVSPSSLDISGYSPEDFMNDPELKITIIHPDDLWIYQKHRESTANGNNRHAVEFRIFRKDGSIRWLSHRCCPVFDSNGTFLGNRGSNQDITEQKLAEAALRENEEKYRLVVENQTDWITKTDTQGRCLYANPAFCETFEKSEDELIGNIFNLTIHPDDAPFVQVNWPNLSNSASSINFDARFMTKEGWLWANWTAKSIADDDGKVSSIILAGRDITERKKAQDALNQSEEKYRVLTENVGDVIWILDTESLLFKYVSKSIEKLRGFTVEEILAKPMDYALTPAAREGLKQLLQSRKEAFLNGTEPPDRVYIDEIEQPCKDGSNVWTEVSTSYYINEDTNRVEVRGVSRNISERKRMEEALHKEINLIEGIMNSVPGLLYLYDDQGKLIRWNKKHEEITGYSSQELHNFHLLDWYKDSPQDMESVTKGIEKAMQEGFASAEAYLQTKSGKKILFDFTASKLEFGNKIYFTGIGIDITARRQNELKIAASQTELQETLKKLEHQLDENSKSRMAMLSMIEDQKIAQDALQREQYLMTSLMDTIPDTIYFKNSQGQFLRVNKAQAKRLGVSDPQELLGKTDFDFFAKEHAQKAFDDELAIIQNGQSIINQEEFLTYNNHKGEWVLTTKMPLYNLEHEIIGTYGVTRDISELKQAGEQLETAYDATLQGWAAALELREKETAAHSRNVVEMTLKLARELGIPEEEMVHVRRGALLHDIGKMGIPDDILLKPGKLTDEEWVIMRMHPIFAFELLSDIPYLQPALNIPYAHHERWDGSGYPLGLKKTDIPFTARIFAVVDVWDALSSDRPYRPAWNNKAVMDYLREKSGSQFDPDVVAAFLRIISNQESVAVKKDSV